MFPYGCGFRNRFTGEAVPVKIRVSAAGILPYKPTTKHDGFTPSIRVGSVSAGRCERLPYLAHAASYDATRSEESEKPGR